MIHSDYRLCAFCGTINSHTDAACGRCGAIGTLGLHGAVSIIQRYLALRERVQVVLKFIEPHAEVERIDFTLNETEPEKTLIEVQWTTYCDHGCCSPDTDSREFPLAYLFLPDEQIKAREEEAKAERARAAAEAQRREKIAHAEKLLAIASKKVEWARFQAAEEVRKLEKQLAALRGEQS